MKKRKINYRQFLQILDGFGGIFLGAYSLLLKNQQGPEEAFGNAHEMASAISEVTEDGFNTVNLDVWARTYKRSFKIFYRSRSGRRYEFTIRNDHAFFSSHLALKRVHTVSWNENSNLDSLIEEVCRNADLPHPNPLFR